MDPSHTLDQQFLDNCKLHKTMVDFMRVAYKPAYNPLQKKPEQSETEYTVAEEYNGLVFYISKIRNVFTAFIHSVKELTDDVKSTPAGNPSSKLTTLDKPEPTTQNEWTSFSQSKNLETRNLKDTFTSLINFPTFMWLNSISKIPSNTEFTYLGELDSVHLKEEIEKFDVVFKKYVGVYLAQT